MVAVPDWFKHWWIYFDDKADRRNARLNFGMHGLYIQTSNMMLSNETNAKSKIIPCTSLVFGIKPWILSRMGPWSMNERRFSPFSARQWLVIEREFHSVCSAAAMKSHVTLIWCLFQWMKINGIWNSKFTGIADNQISNGCTMQASEKVIEMSSV